jgi:hypothetical protein
MSKADETLFPSLPPDFGAKGVSVSVDCNGEVLTVHLTAEQWAKIRQGDWLDRNGPVWHSDEANFRTRWSFSGAALTIEYGNDGGIAFEGNLDEVEVREKGKRGLTNSGVEI